MNERGWIVLVLCALLSTAAATAAEPAQAACPPAATIFGKPVCPAEIEPRTTQQEQTLKARAERLHTVVQLRLLEDYAKRKNLEPTEREMKLLGELFDAKSEFKRGLPKEEVEKSQKLFYGAIIRSWKVNRSLFQHYGGGVSRSGFGFPEAVDAVKAYLKEQEKSGDFKIQDPALAQEFWHTLETANRASILAHGKDAREIFEMPPWEVDPKRDKP